MYKGASPVPMHHGDQYTLSKIILSVCHCTLYPVLVLLVFVSSHVREVKGFQDTTCQHVTMFRMMRGASNSPERRDMVISMKGLIMNKLI